MTGGRATAAADGGRHESRAAYLGDFSVKPRMLMVTAWALVVGAFGGLAAWALLKLIGLVTNLVFYQRVDTALVAPSGAHDPWWLILTAPIVGGLIVGLMARFGSEKIRGHGMPEAIEAILTGGSTVQPKVAVLKPISAAVSIGTGGPFGAEGPIIMTGGAIGSILAQSLHLTADERKTLLVSGAAAGMAATFNSPMAAVLLAVELLLFEWRPRSFTPVVAAVAVATVVRGYLIGTGPIFPVDAAGLHVTTIANLLAVVVGVSGGLLAVVATWLVYKAEDGFGRLPIHWMWWPAIGGVIIGIGGLIEPRALGVGYDVIDELLTGKATLGLILGILFVKTIIWSGSLGSGTSGGVLAPVFMIGGSLGALEGMLFPAMIPGFWAMLGLAAVVGGVMRSPLTGVVFTLELTHVWGAALPLLIASTAGYTLSVLVLKRSVLTEKISRRGLHLTREYSTDPLETFFAEEVMSSDPDAVVRARGLLDEDGTAAPAVVVRTNDTLRHVAYEFAEHHVSVAPVVEDGEPVGMITLTNLLEARLHDLTEERHRERLLMRPAGLRGTVPDPGPPPPRRHETRGHEAPEPFDPA
ncbi:chloride channel protein [Speluncibacter jeojiensis]|uniref:chloride channel protein n=1 Tax=Speluncibacter jeojiensis TaxID=2710754 RepID=UPI00240ECB62|nr:chloride channel protein [Rhodococcus sp. D2-41]